jgi:glycosyltransferase involved in cell wall biosynthesis
MSQIPDPIVLTGSELASSADPPVVTVIVANYNSGPFIEAALQSALRQSLQAIEVIVADDGSTDDSVARIAAMAARDSRLRLLTPAAAIGGASSGWTNMGPSTARNLCIECARGRWIAILDADDLMHPERLARLVAAAERDHADIAADDLLIFHDGDERPPSRCLRGSAASAPFWVDPAAYVRSNALFGNAPALGYLKPIIRTELLTNSDIRYDPELRLAEDYDFIFRLLLHGARMRVYPELTYFYRKHGQSISHRLSTQKLRPVLHASEQSLSAIDPADRTLRAAVQARHASIRLSLDFDALMAALLARRWLHAAGLALRHPGAAALLRITLLARLRSQVRPAQSKPSGARSVCVISRQRVIGNTNGSSVYLLSLCGALRQAGMDIHLVCPSPSVFGRWPILMMQPEMALFRSITIRGAIRMGTVFVATDPRVGLRAVAALIARPLGWLGMAPACFNRTAPYSIALPLSPADAIFLAYHARCHADAIVADYAFLTEGIPYVLRPDARSAVVMHDLFSSRGAQFDRIGEADSVALVSEETEMAFLAGAGAVVAIQPEEAELVRANLPTQPVILAPMAVECVGAPQPGKDGRILFVGSKTAPNIVGLRWFLEKVWPMVLAAVPDAELSVAGSVSGAIAAGVPGVRLFGPVPSLETLYREAAVVISPLPVGSGLKIKLVEALGHGKAVVATTATVQGFEALTREAVAVADEPAAFAAEVTALLRDPSLRSVRGAAALAVARERFSASACYADFVAYVGGRTLPKLQWTTISD